jgi:hypothetical protein
MYLFHDLKEQMQHSSSKESSPLDADLEIVLRGAHNIFHLVKDSRGIHAFLFASAVDNDPWSYVPLPSTIDNGPLRR